MAAMDCDCFEALRLATAQSGRNIIPGVRRGPIGSLALVAASNDRLNLRPYAWVLLARAGIGGRQMKDRPSGAFRTGLARWHPE